MAINAACVWVIHLCLCVCVLSGFRKCDAYMAAGKFKGWNTFWVVMVHYGCKWVLGVSTKEDNKTISAALSKHAASTTSIYTNICKHTHAQYRKHKYSFFPSLAVTLNDTWFVQQWVLRSLYGRMSDWVCAKGVGRIFTTLYASVPGHWCVHLCSCVCAEMRLDFVKCRLWLPAVLCHTDWLLKGWKRESHFRLWS